MVDYIDYESIVFALGGDTICPSCGIGVFIPGDISLTTSACARARDSSLSAIDR